MTLQVITRSGLVLGLAVASMPDRLDRALTNYQAQVAPIRHHRVVAALQAFHFVMLDDPAFLLTTLDEFLGSPVSGQPAAKRR